MKPWIKLVLPGLVLAAVGLAVLLSILIPAQCHHQAQRHAYDSMSLARLQSLAPALLSLDVPAREIIRGDPQMPAALWDLNPASASFNPDRVLIELHGGSDHFGFIFRKVADHPRRYEIYRYTDYTEEELLGEYTESK